MTESRLPHATRLAIKLLVATLPSCGVAKAPPQASPAVPVTVAPARQTDFSLELRVVGSVESPWTVDVRPQVEGALEAIHFREGQDVHAGDLLFTIDPKPYQAVLAAAEANLARDRAQAQNAEADHKRAADLFAQGIVSTDVSDKAAATARALAAGLKADEAAIETAKLRLEYCSIRSPLDGRTGTIAVKVGNLVRALDTVSLVTIHQINPIDVRFTVPEGRLAEIRRAGNLEVIARRRGEEKNPVKGALTFVENEVDRASGGVSLKARFANAERTLWPGQFVDVLVVLGVRKGAVVVPSPAVQDGQQGSFVFVVKKDQTAEVRPVTIGPSRNGETLVEKGIEAGETVVVDGQVKLTVGAKVDAKPAGPAS